MHFFRKRKKKEWSFVKEKNCIFCIDYYYTINYCNQLQTIYSWSCKKNIKLVILISIKLIRPLSKNDVITCT